jgi:hypothetical protein
MYNLERNVHRGSQVLNGEEYLELCNKNLTH